MVTRPGYGWGNPNFFRGFRGHSSAIAFERLGQPDSAAAVYLEILAKTPTTLVNHIPASLVRQSFVLRRLVELGGADAASALDRLQRDWADAEVEFRRRVVDRVLGR